MICPCGVDLRDEDYVHDHCPVCNAPSPKIRNAETVLNWAVNHAYDSLRYMTWDYLTDAHAWYLTNPQHLRVSISTPLSETWEEPNTVLVYILRFVDQGERADRAHGEIEGNTKRYRFDAKAFEEKFTEGDIGLVDAHGNKLALGIPPEQFVGIIQSLINRNQYELMWDRRYKKEV